MMSLIVIQIIKKNYKENLENESTHEFLQFLKF